ncbi:MAG: hypothetical protein A2653_01770 [Candidatus Zambryskibacteria bacterium RIFCSPHIGHO2_01_FULL_43_25]|uniref:SHS2 domain-containing protein n=1 Tax=Candidatus Zambryskibacteria bacterium RIFCSPLOWO2_01_FULL_45_21 TaxID=1802761 RepID=A0A1G2U5H4_9BACT|nr:MAG: hypothetical protein A2653_01770 [Candidatus Zambryskibacteria bacterium RIFCSPHIGHO2_01_FULL_43_25]OHB00556.1 MAG: hypothetical protein A3E94_02045 [Candidatus Zambryskibacteria bacterium RIFCSPHIGHO2_12_FULL_44_12b]OHB04714.1 MAG: hypothetical protein A3B14_01750 [Candidatus Zambryskibacteria bacterium RIFCSPLOWO2_01_FULL_45_21]
MSLFKKVNKEVLVFDIGSKSVAAGLVLLQDKKLPTILRVIRKNLSFDNSVENEQVLKQFIDESIVDIAKNARELPSLRGVFKGAFNQVLFVLRLPWYSSENRRVRIKKDEVFTVSGGLIDRILDEEEKKFEQTVAKGNTSRFNMGAVMIERQPVRVRLNGYDTLNPIQKKTNDLDVSIYMSIAPKSLLKNARDIVLKHSHTEGISFHSFPLVFFESIIALFPQEHNALLIDIGAKDTEISLLKHGALEKSAFFPLGWNFVERKIGESLGTSDDIASSFFRTYQENRLDATTSNAINQAIEGFKSDWLSSVHDSLSNVFEGKISSNVIFLAVEPGYSKLFENFIKDSPELNKLFGIFRVYGLSDSIIKQAVSFHAGGISDPFIAMSAIFINKHGSFLS